MNTDSRSESAVEAMRWHRSGDTVMVSTFTKNGFITNTVLIEGAAQPKKPDSNHQHCKHIAHEIEAYTNGDVFECPDCGEEIHFPDGVGDKFKCPHCHAVNDVDDFEQLSVWNFLSDVYDIEYRVGSDKKYRSVKIMIACGGPNIYIDTACAMVKLYWWTDYAEYPISYEARDAIDEWAEEYWNI